MGVVMMTYSDANAPVMPDAAGSLLDLFENTLINGYEGKDPPGGWTLERSDNNNIGFLSSTATDFPSGTGLLIFDEGDDPNTYYARVYGVRGWTGFTVDTPNHSDRFPTASQLTWTPQIIKWRSGQSSNAWRIIADEAFFYLWISILPTASYDFTLPTFNNNSYTGGYYFGMLAPRFPADPPRVGGRFSQITQSASSSMYNIRTFYNYGWSTSPSSAYSMHVDFDPDGNPSGRSSLWWTAGGMQGSGQVPGSQSMSYINQPIYQGHNKLEIERAKVFHVKNSNSDGMMQHYLPGAFMPNNKWSQFVGHYADQLINLPAPLDGRILQGCPPCMSSSEGIVFIDTTGPWR